MAKNKQDDEVVRSFVWKLMSQEDCDLFDKFRLLVLKESCSVEVKLHHWLTLYCENNEKNGVPVLQAQAIEQLSSEGIETSRVTLNKYRDKGVLVDEDGKPFWYTDGHAIAYDYDRLKQFITYRKTAGVEPLINEAL